MKVPNGVGEIMSKLALFAASVAVVFMCGGARADAFTDLYVQDGLIAHWDGVDNAATGGHDPEARVWKDLVQGLEFSLTDSVVVNDDRLTFCGDVECYGTLDATGTSATFEKAGGTSGATVEIVLKADSKDNAFALQSSTASGMAISRNLTVTVFSSTYSAASAWQWDEKSTNTVSVAYVSKKAQEFFVNGAAADLSKNSSQSGFLSVTTIGGRSNHKDSSFNGSIYSIRVYDRQLSETERQRNAQLDELRRTDPQASQCLQVVSAASETQATCEPLPGVRMGLSAGDKLNVSATSLMPSGEGDTEVVCTGWKLYDLYGVEKESGTSSSFLYEHPGEFRRLVWQWDIKHKVTASCEDGGDVTNALQWVVHGQPFNTLALVADETLAFSRWVDAGGETVGTAAALSLPITQPMTLTAKCRAALYVAKNGNDENAGTSKSAPLLTIAAAIAKASSAGEGTLVTVGPGTYTAVNTTAGADGYIWALCLDKQNVAVVSSDGPSVTTVDAGSGTGSDKTNRAELKVCAEGALFSGFTLVNGCQTGKGAPCGVHVTAGTVANCVISVRQHWAQYGSHLSLSGTAKAYDIVIPPTTTTGTTEFGSLVYLNESASLDGLVITNFVIQGKLGTQDYFLRIGSFYEAACTVRNVLIADCVLGDVDTTSSCPFVFVQNKSHVLSDSTFVNNSISANNGFILVNGASPTIQNCIFWNNTSLSAAHPEIQNGANVGRFFNSCCKELTAGVNGNIVSDPQFKNAGQGDYRLSSVSPAKEMGVVRLRPSGEDEFTCAAEADVNTSVAGEPLTVNFTGSVGGAQGDVSATWFFGDGTSSTDWPTVEHTYTTPGKYAATLTVEDESGRDPVTFEFAEDFTVVPLTCYVKEGAEGAYPYDSWEKATSNLAVAVGVGSRTVLVTNGVYGVPAPHITIGRAISIVSVEGPAVTTLRTASSAAIDRRIFTCINSDDILIGGFTMEGGYAKEYGWAAALNMSAGTLSNCVVRKTERVCRSSACNFSGTARVVGCTFDGVGMRTENDSMDQAGVLLSGGAVADRCEIRGYRIDTLSGDSYFGESPVSVRGTAILRNSLVHHCTNGIAASAQYRGVVTLIGGSLENCTIAGNTTGGYGGGVYANGGTIINSIISGNHAELDGDDLYFGSALPEITYSCSASLTSGEGNVSNTNRLFTTSRKKPSYWLSPNSPAKNVAKVLDWMTPEAVDRIGNPRIAEGAPDMGCYEVRSPGLVIFVR